jgi:putative phosphoribosyl transferase
MAGEPSELSNENKLRDRSSAGLLLAGQITVQNRDETVVVAIPHGGIPVAAAVSRTLRVPTKVCLTTRVALLDNPELSVGAMSCAGDTYLDSDLLGFLAASDEAVAVALPRCRAKLADISRELSQWSADPGLEGKNLLVVDDVIATGNSILGALHYLKRFNPRSVSVAAPVISRYASTLLTERNIDHTTMLVGKESEFKPRNHYSDFTAIDGATSVTILSSL